MKNKIILTILILSIITLIFSGCVNGSTTPNIPDQGDDINHKPIISDLPASPRTAFINQNITITCTASDQDGDTLAYSWSSSPGGTINGIGSNIIWKAPATKGTYTITCLLSDGKGGEDKKSVNIEVDDNKYGDLRTIDWSMAGSNGWKNPLGEGKKLETRTAYDYDSGIYLYNHPEKKHMGIDIHAQEKTNVYAIADGTIRKIVRGSDPEKMVVIIEHTNSNNEDFFAIYGHVFARSDLEVKLKSELEAGDKIGVVKKSGSPCHLHFGVNLSSEFIDDLLAGNCGWGRIPESANPSEYDWVDPIDYLNTHSIENIVLGSYTITASAGSNGSISPSGNVTVNQGSDKSFNITPDTGYQIDDVLVDGSSIGAENSYTFTNVTEDHSISATFTPNDFPQPSLTGKIAFESNRDGNEEIYVMNADGSNQTRLTNNPGLDGDPCFSPDGTKIAFRSNRDVGWEIYVMNADGSNQTRLTNEPGWDENPCFSPDGTKIAFASYHDGNREISVMNADGSNQTRLTNNPGWDADPCFSPDGTKIAFTSDHDGNREISVMNADGSNQTNITNNSGYNFDPCFSPDGTKIAFASLRDGNREIYVMNADGSNQTNITNNPAARDWEPSWAL
jgi:TolB protein